MDHIESLLQLIGSKEKMVRGDTISLSLGEIADVWGRRNILRKYNHPPVFDAFGDPEYIDHSFLEDVTLALRELELEKFTVFEKCSPPTPSHFQSHFRTAVKDKSSLSNILNLSSLSDRIYLKIEKTAKTTEAINKLTPTSWFNYKNSFITFDGHSYKPRKESHVKFIRQLLLHYQAENNKGEVIRKGQRTLEKVLSNETNATIEQLNSIRKQVSRIFREQKFPLKIDRNTEGILLIYTI